MKLFRQKTTVFLLDGKRVSSSTPGAERHTILSKRWYATIRNEHGKRINLPLSSDKRAATALLQRELDRIERAKAGVQTAEDLMGQVEPIDKVLTAFEASLTGKGNDSRYVSLVLSRLRDIISGCEFETVHDINAERFTAWFAERIKKAKTGAKKVAERPLSEQTQIHYRSHFKSLVKWCLKTRRLSTDPLLTIQVHRTVRERVFARRAMSRDELAKLLSTTSKSKHSYRGLTGKARHALYCMAASTGIRASGLASLRPVDFDFVGPVPCVTLSVKRDKSRRGKVQPIPDAYLKIIRDYVTDRPLLEPVWPGTWVERGVRLIRRDAIAAGLPIRVDGPNGAEWLDFHSLRHTYLTLLGESGVDLLSLQELAGHSTPTLTAKYCHRKLADLAEKANKLK